MKLAVRQLGLLQAQDSSDAARTSDPPFGPADCKIANRLRQPALAGGALGFLVGPLELRVPPAQPLHLESAGLAQRLERLALLGLPGDDLLRLRVAHCGGNVVPGPAG